MKNKIYQFKKYAGPTIFIVVFLSFIWLCYSAFQAQYELNKAKLHAAKLRSHSSALQAKDVADAISAVRSDIASAHQDVSGPVWWVAAHIPYLGRTPNAIQTTVRNLDSMLQSTILLESSLRSNNSTDAGKININVVTASLKSLTTLKYSVNQGAQQISQLNLSGVPSAISNPVHQVGTSLRELQPVVAEADSFSNIAPVLFGLTHPKKWLLVFHNGAETRSTGGLPGGWGVLNVHDGKFELENLHTNSVFNNRPLLNWQNYVSADQAQLYGDDLSRFSDMNLSPDYPTNGKLMTAIFEQDTGEHVDGVLSMDQDALANLVSVTGPIKFGEKTLDSTNIAGYINKGVYADYPNPAEKDSALFSIIRKTFDYFRNGSVGPVGLVRAFVPSMHSGYMHLWAKDQNVEKSIVLTDLGGSLENVKKPTSAVVFVNGAGNKIDSYVSAEVRYMQSLCTVDTPYRKAFMRINLENTAPTSGLPRYVTPRSDLPKNSSIKLGSTKMVIYVHAPLGSVLDTATIDGNEVSAVASGVDTGRQVWRFDTELDPQKSRALLVNFEEPAIGNEPQPSVWTQSMPIPVVTNVENSERCVR